MGTNPKAGGAEDEEAPLTLVVLDHDSNPIAAVPVDGTWHEAMCWGWLAWVAHRQKGS